MNESSIGLTFQVLFVKDYNYEQTVFRPLVNQFNDTFTYTNSFRNQYFTANQSDLRERKEKITKLFVGS